MAILLTGVLCGCQGPKPQNRVDNEPPGLRSGDIVFQDSAPRSDQAEPIKKLTKSEWSHCGFYFETPGGGAVVIDGNGSPGPIPWDQWRARAAGGEYANFRLRRGLTREQTANLQAKAARYDRRPYDFKFAWGDGEIYCSELIWKAWRDAFQEYLCPPATLGEFNLRNSLARKLIERPDSWGSVEKVNRDEPVVSPQAIANSPLLIRIH